MSIHVERNHFYIKKDFDDMVIIRPQYGDLPLSVGTEIGLGATLNQATLLNKVTRPATPSFGDSKPIGAVVQLYSSDVDALTQQESGDLSIFRCNPDIPLTEGGFTLAKSGSTSVGESGSLYITRPVNEFPLINEEFDGKILDSGMVQRVGNNNITTYKDPYLTLANLIWMVNDKNGTNYAVPSDRDTINAYLKMFTTMSNGYNAELQDKIVVNHRHVNMGGGFWCGGVVQNGRVFGDIRDYLGPQQIFSYERYGSLVDYNEISTSTIDIDSTPVASENNTIFTDITATLNNTNPFNSDANNPLIYTATELSPDNTYNGGQAFRMYHDWGYSQFNNKIQSDIGVSGNLNAQMARATVSDLPFPPLPFDIAQNTFDSSTSTYINGNHRGVAPEICMDLMITKMAPAVQLNLATAAAVDTLQDYYNNNTTSCPKASCGDDALSFLRNFTITFSNFKPKVTEDVSLDVFLKSALQGYYGGQRKVVGGLTIMKLGIGSDNTATSGSSLLAMPLTVMPVPQALSGTTAQSNTIMAEAGMVKVNGVAGADKLENSSLMTMGSLPKASDGTLVDANMPQYLQLPSSTWLKLRFFTDPTMYNNSGTLSRNPYSGATAYGGATPTDTQMGQRGSFMRLYVDVAREASTTGDTENWDFIDIPFPAKSGKPGGESWNLLEEQDLWPKYMTLWAQNYPWVSTTDVTWGGTSSTTIFNQGDSQTTENGASRELEVYVDNIRALNFSPDITNVTANSSAGALTLKAQGYTGPLGSMFNATKYRKSWYNKDTTAGGAYLEEDISNQEGGKMFNYNAGQYICFGFDSTAHFGTTGTNISEGYFLFNDFTSTSWKAVSGSAIGESQFKNAKFANPSSAATAGATISRMQVKAADGTTNITVPLGGQMSTSTGLYTSGSSAATQYDVVSGSVHVVSTGAAASNKISLGQGANTFFSTDGLRQKGFLWMSVNGATQHDAWEQEKQENILVSTKVIKAIQRVPYEVMGVHVADSSIFNASNPDETYRIYKMGAPRTSANMSTNLTMDTEHPLNENGTINFNEADWKLADDGTNLITEQNMPMLWIGPEKYWINMLIDSSESIAPRSWKNVCQVDETPSDTGNQLGSTYNEFLYYYNTSAETSMKSGLYNNRWELRPSPLTLGDFVIRNEDNGFGASEEGAGSTGGELGIGTLARGRYNYIDINEIVNKDDVGPNQTFPLYFEFGGLGSVTSTTISTDNNAFYEQRPTIYWKYEDLPPVITSLTVTPAYDLLSDETNLYDLTTANLNAVKFNWEEENADDTWYKMMIIDENVPINDKYHNAKMWVPLNEVPDSPEDVSSTRYKVYNPAAQTSGNCDTDVRVYSVLDGQAGWCALMKQAESVSGDGEIEIPNATNTALEALDEFTLVVHWTPSVGDKANVASIVNQTSAAGTASNNFEMYKDASNKIVVKLGANTTMTGTTSIQCDGLTPYSLILTYNSGSSLPEKNKLYINGVLDVASTTSGSISTGKSFHIGAPNNGTDPRGSTGKFEEIIIYSTEHEIIDASKEHIYNTVDELDIINNSNVTKNARLFVFDYHNIRGTTPQEVGMSQSTSWRVTTL